MDNPVCKWLQAACVIERALLFVVLSCVCLSVCVCVCSCVGVSESVFVCLCFTRGRLQNRYFPSAGLPVASPSWISSTANSKQVDASQLVMADKIFFQFDMIIDDIAISTSKNTFRFAIFFN